MVKAFDIKGQKFGLLTVLHESPRATRKSKLNRCWFVICDCGSEPFEIEQRSLTRTGVKSPKLTQSCGCIRSKAAFVATNKFGVDLDYLEQFDDLDKYLFVHKQIVKLVRVKGLLSEYDKYIQHFYYSEQFNSIYNYWKAMAESRGETFYDMFKPSIDHKTPLSRGGDNSIENLHFLTIFENLAKRDMTWKEWEEFKQNTDFGRDLMIGGRKL